MENFDYKTYLQIMYHIMPFIQQSRVNIFGVMWSVIELVLIYTAEFDTSNTIQRDMHDTIIFFKVPSRTKLFNVF